MASIFLNLVLKKYGELPPTYQVVGFDDSPIASEYLIPFSTIHQQIDVLTKEAMDILVMQMKNRKKRRPAIMETPIHKTVLPTLIKRETTIFSFYPKGPRNPHYWHSGTFNTTAVDCRKWLICFVFYIFKLLFANIYKSIF